jgi:ABC-type multidrug transport system fused ATPase/permease subunit
MIRRFASYYLPHKRLFIIDFFSAVVVAVLELAFPLAVQWFIDRYTATWRRLVCHCFGKCRFVPPLYH